MARRPGPDETKKLLTQTRDEETTKLAEQREEGKDFVNNGQGVIPEEIWQNLPGKQEEQGE